MELGGENGRWDERQCDHGSGEAKWSAHQETLWIGVGGDNGGRAPPIGWCSEKQEM